MLLSDIHDAVQKGNQLSVLIMDGAVQGLPEPRLESTALGIGALDRVPLDGHTLWFACLSDAQERGAQVPLAIGIRIVGVIREDREERLTKDVSAFHASGCKVTIAGLEDGERLVRLEHDVEAGERADDIEGVRLSVPRDVRPEVRRYRRVIRHRRSLPRRPERDFWRVR